MNCEHTTCHGPVCTASTGPKRALVGLARARAAIRQDIMNAIGPYGHVLNSGATSIKAKYWYLADAVSTVRHINDLMILKQDVKFSIRLEIGNSQTAAVAVSFKLVKP